MLASRHSPTPNQNQHPRQHRAGRDRKYQIKCIVFAHRVRTQNRTMRSSWRSFKKPRPRTPACSRQAAVTFQKTPPVVVASRTVNAIRVCSCVPAQHTPFEEQQRSSEDQIAYCKRRGDDHDAPLLPQTSCCTGRPAYLNAGNKTDVNKSLS